MARPAPTIHWLRENAVERSPHRLLIVDTETRLADPADPARQTLRLWCATLIRRHEVEPRKPRRETFRGTDAEALADLVERVSRSGVSTWVYTHNLGFDLAVTELPVRLAARGWRVTEAALTTDQPWCRLSLRSRRLTMADSWSWLPTSVEALGALVGVPKVPLPAEGDDDEDWWHRCVTDVAIVERALVSLMDWWDAGRYGNWSVTGPATGWSSYRHGIPRPRVLVDPDPAARAAESAAVSGGRREITRIGTLPGGLYADLDLSTAHLAVMAGCALPFRRFRRFEALAIDDPLLGRFALDVMALATVELERPRWPWDSGRGVFYPIGTFRTTLTGPELREARDRGELRAIGPGHLYGMGPHMAGWARWIASLLDLATPGVPPAVRLMAKHWSRCVPGKWAGHTSEVIDRRPDGRPGWHVERGYLADGHRPADFLRLGGELWTIARDEWAEDAFPAVLAFIQGWTRVALGRLIDAAGPAMLSANTDGMLVDVDALLAAGDPPGPPRSASVTARLRALDAWCAAWDGRLGPFSLRIKGAARAIQLISPQHAIVDGELRLAGVPRRAVPLGGGRYTFTAWPKLRLQLAREGPPGYRTVERTIDLAAIAPAGWLRADGSVTPVRLALGPDGSARIDLGGSGEGWPADLAPLAEQHPVIRRAWAAGTAGGARTGPEP